MTLHAHIASSETLLTEAVAAANAGVLELPWTENSWIKVRGSLTALPGIY